MHALAALAGAASILLALLDAFQTVILPRRASGRFRMTRLFYKATWAPWSWLARRPRTPRRRETLLWFYGPFSLVLLIALWALLLLFGYACLVYAAGSPLADPLIAQADFRSDLYISGTTLFTLGLGDVVPRSRLVRELLVLEAGLGLAFFAMLLGYFPVLYGAFSRREVNISLLDARAGSPPSAAELMRRHAFDGGPGALRQLLEEWERWAAELLESHISYPVLCYFRSQHTNQSWLSALCAVLDSCALVVASVEELPARQAQLTFAMARHAVVDLAQIFDLRPTTLPVDRLPAAKFKVLHDLLCQAGTRVAPDAASLERLNAMRGMYEPYVAALGRYLGMTLPLFVADGAPRRDNWQTVARVRRATEEASREEEHHVFLRFAAEKETPPGAARGTGRVGTGV